MKRKRKVIFTITSLYLDEDEGVECSSTIGWYPNLKTAQKCVEEDWPDIDEAGYYNYVVIERVVEGLYNMSGMLLDRQTEWWYSFDYKQEKWIACEKPQWSVGTINWGLG
jgi:hypothetical protein